MEFKIFEKKFRFKDGRVEYFYKSTWRIIGTAKTLKEAIESATYYALCTTIS